MTACAYIGLSVIAAGQIIISASSVGVQAAYNDRQNNINIEETPDYNSYIQTVYGRENGIPGAVPMI